MKLKTVLLVLALLLAPALGLAATGTVAPVPYHSFYDNSGDPCASCRVFTYEAGTSTKTSTYNSVDLSVANANPLVLDSAGRGKIFLASGSYKFVFAAAGSDDPPASPIWTIDSVSNVPAAAVNVDVDGTAGEALAAGEAVYLSAGDGGRTAGRWYLADADLTYGSTTASALGFAVTAISSGSSGTIRLSGRVTGLTALSAGTTYYISATAGALTSTPPTNARKIGVADSSTTLIASPWLPIVEATGSVAGIVSLTAQTLGAGVKTFTDHGQFEPGTSTGTNVPWSGCYTPNVTDVGTVGAGEDDLMTFSVPANVLSANGKGVNVMAWGTYGATANVKTLKGYFGATSVTLSSNAVNDSRWYAELLVVSTGASAQILTGWTINRSDGVSMPAEATPAGDTTTALTVKFTGEATDNNDIVQKGMIVCTIN